MRTYRPKSADLGDDTARRTRRDGYRRDGVKGARVLEAARCIR